MSTTKRTTAQDKALAALADRYAPERRASHTAAALGVSAAALGALVRQGLARQVTSPEAEMSGAAGRYRITNAGLREVRAAQETVELQPTETVELQPTYRGEYSDESGNQYTREFGTDQEAAQAWMDSHHGGACDTSDLRDVTEPWDAEKGQRVRMVSTHGYEERDGDGFGRGNWTASYVVTDALQHADYPHEPGTLYDCAACEARCHCTPDDAECIYSGTHATFREVDYSGITGTTTVRFVSDDGSRWMANVSDARAHELVSEIAKSHGVTSASAVTIPTDYPQSPVIYRHIGAS